MKQILFNGTLKGKVVSDHSLVGYTWGNTANRNFLSFRIRLDVQIEGIPEEFPVYAEKVMKREYLINTHLRKGDIVQITGKVIQNYLLHWKKNVIWMKADHIYNETTNFGY